jgi:hypothetical protein
VDRVRVRPQCDLRQAWKRALLTQMAGGIFVGAPLQVTSTEPAVVSSVGKEDFVSDPGASRRGFCSPYSRSA